MEETVMRLVRELERRRYGKYRGKVVDNEDDKHMGRLKVAVPSLFGQDALTWALPCVPFGGRKGQGLFFLPEKGSMVWIEFEEGDVTRPIWTGTFWAQEEDSPRRGPAKRILQTPSGHRLQFEDRDENDSGDRRVELTHANDSKLVLEEDGSVKLRTSKGMVLEMEEGGTLRLEDGTGNLLRMDDDGWSAEDHAGNRIEMTRGQTTLKAKSRVHVDAPSVSLGGHAEPVLKGLSFLTKYMTHTHTVAPIVGGPTSPPIPQGEMDTLSKKVTTG